MWSTMSKVILNTEHRYTEKISSEHQAELIHVHRVYTAHIPGQAERLKAGIATGVKVHGRDAFPSLHQPVIGVLKSHGGFPRPIANSTHDGHERRLYAVRRTPGCHSRLRITWESFSAPIMPHCNNSAWRIREHAAKRSMTSSSCTTVSRTSRATWRSAR